MENLLKAKSDQAIEILQKQDVDLWVIAARESSASPDPSIPLVVGGDVTWISFFLFSATGKKIALVGNFDAPLFQKLGHFDEVRGYTKGVREDLHSVLHKLKPKKIALNYSIDYHMADGLKHGLYIYVLRLLSGTPYEGMLISSENLLGELRAVKLPEELDRIREACSLTEKLFGSIKRKLKAGMSGIEVYEFLKKKVESRGLEFSFEPSICIGTKSPQGHTIRTDDVLDKGELFHIDFGVIYKDYCSDMQRVIYLLRDGETEPPEEVQTAFDTVSGIIKECARQAKPGTPGYAIDAIARDMLRERGFPEYQHALGHQLGRYVHDGGVILGPKWERYGKSPYGHLQEGNVFTLEFGITVKDRGVVGLEEDVVITSKGAKFLSKPQRRIICV
ncbi:MAG: M24 family metallopeptidase [candidate division Zixibacteria bacterium]|nr:M24 family metallopeptidase [candidate division Zixibacteria bacterium]